jgi:hypothetical protein
VDDPGALLLSDDDANWSVSFAIVVCLPSIADFFVAGACMALAQQAHAEAVPRPVDVEAVDVEAVAAVEQAAVEALLEEEEVVEEVVVVEVAAVAGVVVVVVSLLVYQVVYGYGG